MTGAFILTLYLMSATNGDISGTTQVHASQPACEAAIKVIRQAIGQGKVVLAVCNPQ